MSTRSRIAKENPDHTYTSIYCHWDGYPGYVGKVLKEYYKDEKKVSELISLGDLSSLGKEINPDPTKKHNFDHPQPDVCTYYHRDRDEEWDEVKPVESKTLDDLRVLAGDTWAEYIYVYTLDHEWKLLEEVKRHELIDY